MDRNISKLALFGGSPEVEDEEIVEEWPIITPEDIKAVVKCMKKRDLWGTFSPTIQNLEQSFARYVGTQYCLTLANGTAALHVALACSGLSAQAEVIVPAFSFISSALAIKHAGLKPVFCDIDADTFNLNPLCVEKMINPNTEAILAVHLHGLPANMSNLLDISKKKHILLIEDCAQAHGAMIKGKKVGSIGNVGTFSLMPGKNLPAAGEGGLLTTSSDNIYYNALRMRDSGALFGKSVDCDLLGYNYRMSSLPAVMALNQLKKLDKYNSIRRENAKLLCELLSDAPGLIMPFIPDGYEHVFHLFRIKINPLLMNVDIDAYRMRLMFCKAVEAEGVKASTYLQVPLPAFPVFHSHQCPHTLERYPNTLDTIRSSFILGFYSLCPPNNEHAVRAIARGILKVYEYRQLLAEKAREMNNVRDPWDNSLYLF